MLQKLKRALTLLSPLMLFPLLAMPYSFLNSAVIVRRFGRGCPQADELGNFYEPAFNANDFTRLFWLAMALLAAGVSLFTMRRLSKAWMRVLYVACVAAAALWTAGLLTRQMMWK